MTEYEQRNKNEADQGKLRAQGLQSFDTVASDTCVCVCVCFLTMTAQGYWKQAQAHSSPFRSIHIWVPELQQAFYRTECILTLHRSFTNYGAGANMVAEAQVKKGIGKNLQNFSSF